MYVYFITKKRKECDSIRWKYYIRIHFNFNLNITKIRWMTEKCSISIPTCISRTKSEIKILLLPLSFHNKIAHYRKNLNPLSLKINEIPPINNVNGKSGTWRLFQIWPLELSMKWSVRPYGWKVWKYMFNTMRMRPYFIYLGYLLCRYEKH